VAATALCLGSLAACDSGTSSPPGSLPDVTTTDTVTGSDTTNEDVQTGDGEADSVETDTEEEVVQREATPPAPLTPTLTGGTASSDGFSTRFSLTVPVTTEPAESENYRVNTGQFTIPPAPEEE